MTAPVIVEGGRASIEEIASNLTNASQGDNDTSGLPERACPASPPSESLEEAAPAAADIGAVVSKAKRAATSLWILIHAQNCRVGGNNCPHQGCTEAKKVLLHLKTCPAVNGCACPINCNGCHQARKLLAHHKRCRELRAKQAATRRAGQQQPQPHVCLVCSLVARHAKNLLEGKVRAARSTNPRKQLISSFTLKQSDSTVMIPRGLNSGLSVMPPPPPRPSASRSSSPPLVPIRGRRRVESSPDTMSESPPPENSLLQLSEIAAASGPPDARPPNPLALGKSLDSSKSSFLTFAAGMLQKMKEAPLAGDVRRSRAESLDMSSVSRQHRGRHMPSTAHAGPGNDPTLEFELTRGVDEDIGEGCVVRRPRSASLGVLVDCALQRVCPPILEEIHEVREPEEQPFLMEE